MELPLLADDFEILYESPEPVRVYAYTPGLERQPWGRLADTMDRGGPGVAELSGPKGRQGEGRNAWPGRLHTSDRHGTGGPTPSTTAAWSPPTPCAASGS